ncbi:TonB-dependent hemoglobin/transferrin/lactoferrin family receptor [Janthinobacterium fluminis]|uniref:TonB-dependent hemoglobin/transferrin/lactoferrin family receptor n=1 Tax=Janthinobacterium fluminis TaxID=2987524 RepID=A0ABT5K005_9BURK|nr:TonB-dependent hemoglobin/transferrin/lactoferrin family receptor [Janthinobacterium fluminis]MDC8758303.1 TonB-dependent hemoglobin/transferrin/lactoferrin family receptor [Janthinobacterium fluminis]
MILLSAGVAPVFARRRLDLALAAAFAATSLAPHAYAEDVRSVRLGELVVSATRTEAEADSLSATVTSVDRDALDRRQPRDEADLFRDEPDVSMARDLRRFGATRVNIRGIEDNRVVQMVDGVRLPDYYNGGGPSNFTMGGAPGAMPDFLKRVEIVRGAASSLYGSDAIGGVVGYLTLDPADLLRDGAGSALRLKAGYHGANEGRSQTVLGAFGAGSAQFLLGYAQMRAKEAANMGAQGGASSSRSLANPQDATDRGLLAKLVLRPAAGHKLVATVEGRKQQADSEILRLAAAMPKLTFMRGDDNVRRRRASVEWEHKPAAGLYDRLTARLFRTDAATANHNAQRRSNTSATCSAAAGAGNNCLVAQDFYLDQESSGAGLLLEKGLKTGALEHVLSAGLDLGRVRVEEKRDARIRNETRGVTLPSLAGEVYPLRDFAIGVTDTVGLFVQDEIGGLAGGRLSLTPALRFDRTRLKPEVDALAQQTLTQLGRGVVRQTHSAVSPKLGAQWQFSSAVTAYAQAASGFRAPNYNEVNGAFRNASQFYATVPNPDLKPEKSVGVELGLRLAAGPLRLQLAAYDNRYKDFIETVMLSCPRDPLCYSPSPAWRTNMAVNLTKVRIYGAEARANWDIAPGWRGDAALALVHGSNEQDGQPLNSVEPARLSLGLLRDAGSWGAEARVRAAARKRSVDDSAGTFFRTPGHAVADLAAWLKLGRNVRLNVAVNNLLDRKYWLWSDIRQADAPDPAGVDFYSQPGRKLSVAVQADF